MARSHRKNRARKIRTSSSAEKTSRKRAGCCSRPGRRRSNTSWESNPMGKEAFSNWCTWKRGATTKTKRRSETHFLSPGGRAKATFRGVRRHHREGRSAGDLTGEAKLLFGLAFRSGYTWMFQAAGSQEASRASADRGEEPQI